MTDRLLITTLTIFGLIVLIALGSSIVITHHVIDETRYHAYLIAEKYREGLTNGAQKDKATNENEARAESGGTTRES